MGGVIDLQTVDEGDLKSHLQALATAFLTGQGDTSITVTQVSEQRAASSRAAQVYWIEFESDGGTNIVQITRFSNGTHKVEEL
jgi:hypothetical protein